MCVRWFDSVCEVDVCSMRVCAIVSGFADGVLSATAVAARAERESRPEGVRFVLISCIISLSSGRMEACVVPLLAFLFLRAPLPGY